MSLKSLINDARFSTLPPDQQRKAVETIEPRAADLNDADYGKFVGSLKTATSPVETQVPAAPESLAAKASKFAVNGLTLPLRNPLINPLQNAGERVNSAVQDVGNRLVKSSVRADTKAPMTRLVGGSLIQAAGDIGKPTPENLATLIGAELGTRILTPVVGGMAAAAGKKGLSVMSGLSEEAINAALKKPQILEKTLEGTARSMPEVANKFDQSVAHLTDIAKSKLSKSRFIEPTATDAGGAFTKDEVLGAIDKARKNLGGVYTPESESAVRVLEKIKANLNKLRNTASQNQGHDLIMDLDKEIPWKKLWKAPETLTKTDETLIEARTRLDKMLKDKNPDYAEEIGKVSDLIENRNEFLKTLKLDKVRGEGYIPSDQTMSAMQGVRKESKIDLKRVLGRTKELTGEDVLGNVQDALHGEDFRQPGKGRKFTIAGAGAGGAIGAKVGGYAGATAGAAIGGGAGAAVDARAPKIVGDLVKIYVKGKTLMFPLKYAPISLGIRAIPEVGGQDSETAK